MPEMSHSFRITLHYEFLKESRNAQRNFQNEFLSVAFADWFLVGIACAYLVK